jgi:hypothetical protein
MFTAQIVSKIANNTEKKKKKKREREKRRKDSIQTSKHTVNFSKTKEFPQTFLCPKFIKSPL